MARDTSELLPPHAPSKIMGQKFPQAEASAHTQRMWQTRRAQKQANGQKLTVVFVCSRSASWTGLHSICQAFINDPRCQVFIIAIPEGLTPKRPGKNEAFDYLNGKMSCRVINGYNPETRQWFNPKTLQPDYVFLQTPYDNSRGAHFHSAAISAYAKVCYLSYGLPMFSGSTGVINLPESFFQNVAFYYYESPLYEAVLEQFYASLAPHTRGQRILSGSPRLDTPSLPDRDASPLWKCPAQDTFRIVWTPRWTMRDHTSHFLAYKDKFFQLCDSLPDIELVSRPHPLTLTTMEALGFMTRQDIADYMEAHEKRPNASLDRRPYYLDTFASSDVLITDISSVIPEYMATGKPVIYCHRNDCFNDVGRKLAEGFYWAHSWDEVLAFVHMLKRHRDPLQERRRQILNEVFFTPPNGSGEFIKNSIITDFFSSPL